ncbi:unnamed protein product [Mycena citricolor]|uniref:tRNA (guanine(10)-N(2))-methyltransferase TRMT11 N-terminal domain-containing protein n=1 Tax=Mycena citricolor TaxID=2018698 RepID=A0AAD2HTE6_9AGAR|nr:unnamed protein product [Mycena citricolor]
MPVYLIVFAQSHPDFRVPELQSIAELFGFSIAIPEQCDTSRPFLVIEIDTEQHARMLASRCILIKHIYEFYAQGSSYDELHAANKRNGVLWERYKEDTSFKFVVTGYNHTIPDARQRSVMNDFKYMEFKGTIDLKHPELILGCFEEYDTRETSGPPATRGERDGQFRQVYFGRWVVDGTARPLVKTFDVKKRHYFGNTSMESEISLIMANQALVRSAMHGELDVEILPRPDRQSSCTTHSVALGAWHMHVQSGLYDGWLTKSQPAAYFGALVFGSDIDGRQMRGKTGQGEPPGVIKAAKQYGVADHIIDLCTFDVTRNPWRCGDLFDTIVTDPPYGVRAGAKRLGRKKELSEVKKAMCLAARDRSNDQPYIPPTKPYELSHLAVDLVLLARYLLKPGGRLVFFLPTVNENYEEIDVQSMLCEGMELVANSLQDLDRGGEGLTLGQLVTVRKTSHATFPPPTLAERTDDSEHVPAHKNFREQYFRGFK